MTIMQILFLKNTKENNMIEKSKAFNANVNLPTNIKNQYVMNSTKRE